MYRILNHYKYDLKETLVFFAFIFVSIRILEYLWSRRNLYIKLLKIPGPLYLPLIGSGYIFFRNPNDYMKLMVSLQRKYQQIYKVWLGPRLVVVVSEPKYIEKLLTSPRAIEKPDFYDIINEVLGPGILTAPGKAWKVHRKAIAPSFNKNILDSYVKIFAESSNKFVTYLKTVTGQKDVDWCLLAKRYSLETACKTTMGVDLDVMGVDLDVMHTGPRGEDLGHCIEMINVHGTTRVLRLWHHLQIYYKFSRTKQQFDKYKNLFNEITSSLVKQKIKEFKRNKDDDSFAEIEEKKKRSHLLELLLGDSTFTEKTLNYEVNTFLGAATDTTGMFICSLFIMLGMHPDIQQKVYEEVLSVVGFNREVEASDLVRMKYCERVIKETLRLFPPVVIFGRILTGDIELGEYVIPKDATVAFIPSITHRCPEYWKDPLTFNPDRFLPEEIIKRHPCSYFPFSYGPRNCIGLVHADQNLKTILATVIREFKVFTSYKSIEEVEFTLQGVISFTKGINIWFESRT